MKHLKRDLRSSLIQSPGEHYTTEQVRLWQHPLSSATCGIEVEITLHNPSEALFGAG